MGRRDAPNDIDAKGTTQMRKFFTNLSTVAALSLAAVPALGLLQAAHAAEPTTRILVGDLNLRSPADAATFNGRVDVQGKALCHQIIIRDGSRGLRQDECLNQVRLEAQRQLSSTQRDDLRQAAKASPIQVATR
jgi:UrcA family protein